jgi:hypothetical protein
MPQTDLVSRTVTHIIYGVHVAAAFKEGVQRIRTATLSGEVKCYTIILIVGIEGRGVR